MCQHAPSCPAAEVPDRLAARVIACHPEQGWSLLCNGVVVFDLPGGTVIEPHRAAGRLSAGGSLPDGTRPRGGPRCRTAVPVREGRAGLRPLLGPARPSPVPSPCDGSARFFEGSAVEEFGYIVVGAGTAGCVVAARLSQDAGVRVLLLRPGARSGPAP